MFCKGMTIWMLLMAMTATVVAQSNSLYRRADEESLARSRRGGLSSGSINDENRSGVIPRSDAVSVLQASWFTVDEPTPKDFRVHDLVTIVINEASKNSTKADTKADRKYDLQAAINEWVKLEGGALRPKSTAAGAPKLDMQLDRSFEGKGDIKREDTLSARIQAEIIDVMPNGNLVVEATHTVTTDKEVTVITLTGTCRSKDIAIDNSIISTKVANLKVTKTHEGIASDATKRGVLSGLFDWMAIF